MKNSTSGKYENNHYDLLRQWKVKYVTLTQEKLFCKEYYNIRSTRSNTSYYNLRCHTECSLFAHEKKTFWKKTNSLHILNLSTVTLWRNKQKPKLIPTHLTERYLHTITVIIRVIDHIFSTLSSPVPESWMKTNDSISKWKKSSRWPLTLYPWRSCSRRESPPSSSSWSRHPHQPQLQHH